MFKLYIIICIVHCTWVGQQSGFVELFVSLFFRNISWEINESSVAFLEMFLLNVSKVVVFDNFEQSRKVVVVVVVVVAS